MLQEIESKFRVESLWIFDRIRSEKRIAGHHLTNSEQVVQCDVYFDTLNGRLCSQGKSFRLRQSQGKYAVTFKEKTAELHVRMEFEEAITESQAQHLLDSDLTNVCQVEAIEVAISHLGKDKINPALSLRNKREKWYLDSRLANLEICFDSIQYMDIGQSRFFEENELELELKKGDPKFHRKITNLLFQQYTLIPNFQSKYERGVELLNVFNL